MQGDELFPPRQNHRHTQATEVCVHQAVLYFLCKCLQFREGTGLRAGVRNQVGFGSLYHRHKKQMA